MLHHAVIYLHEVLSIEIICYTFDGLGRTARSNYAMIMYLRPQHHCATAHICRNTLHVATSSSSIGAHHHSRVHDAIRQRFSAD